MSHETRRLHDLINACDELAGYLDGKHLDDFLSEPSLVRIAERMLILIGEAAKHLTQAQRDAIDQPWREIMGLRDFAVHHYHRITPERLYATCIDDVADLRAAVATYLDKGP